jgi:hypothetical protein
MFLENIRYKLEKEVFPDVSFHTHRLPITLLPSGIWGIQAYVPVFFICSSLSRMVTKSPLGSFLGSIV